VIDHRKFRFMADKVPNSRAMARRIRGMGGAMSLEFLHAPATKFSASFRRATS
jgi:hypothetical protein